MRNVLMAMGCGFVVLVIGGASVGFFLMSSSGGGPPSTLTADPALQALVAPRLSVVDSLAASVVPTCPAHRAGTAPSPAIGTPIVGWPETRGVEVACMFVSSPGGGATGGGFEVYGDTSTPAGSWSAYGPSGWHLDACGPRGSADCTDYAVSETDPSVVWIESTRRLPSGDGWVQIRVVMRR